MIAFLHGLRSRRRPWAAAGCAIVAVAAALLAGCTQTVSGHAANGGFPSGPSTTLGQSGSGPTASPPHTVQPPQSSPPRPGARLTCPRIVDPASQLSYSCAVAGMTRGGGSMWPLAFEKTVDTGWTLDEGSGGIAMPAGHTTAEVANSLASQMEADSYGPSPTVKKERDAAITVGGKQAHLVQVLITLNPAFRQDRRLKVSQERLWIVVVGVSASRAAAWYVSVPDVQKRIWPTVPSLIKGIKVV